MEQAVQPVQPKEQGGCPALVAAMIGAWLALLLAAGLNAGWLFSALMKAGLQFRSASSASLDSEETGRVMAGVLAQPGFVVVFLTGLVVGPLSALLLLRGVGPKRPGARRPVATAALLAFAGAVGLGQLWMARGIAELALERTEAMVSGDSARADMARAALDARHRNSETVYAAQVGMVAVAAVLLARRPRH